MSDRDPNFEDQYTVNCIPGYHRFPVSSPETGEPLGRCMGCGRTVEQAEGYDETCSCECGDPIAIDGLCTNCDTIANECDEFYCGRHARQQEKDHRWMANYATADPERDIRDAGRGHLLA